MPRIVFCKRLNKEAEGLESPPYPGELGQRIYQHISRDGWQQWLDHQTMLINEYRLNLTDQKSRDFLVKEMETFLFEQSEDKPAGYVPPSSD